MNARSALVDESGESSSPRMSASGYAARSELRMIRSAPVSTSVTKSVADLLRHSMIARSWARAPMNAAAAIAAVSMCASSAAASNELSCTTICALVAWSDVDNLQRDSTFGRAAHRELPRRRQELGRAAEQIRMHLLYRRLSRD